MKFIECSIRELESLDNRNTYAGGSNLASATEFKAYLLSKNFYGQCGPDYAYCYFARTQNVMASEDRLLRVARCNTQRQSNCQPDAGFVYVVTPGLRQL